MTELIQYRGMKILIVDNESEPPQALIDQAEGNVAFTKFEWETVYKHPDVVRAMINVKRLLPGSGIPDPLN